MDQEGMRKWTENVRNAVARVRRRGIHTKRPELQRFTCTFVPKEATHQPNVRPSVRPSTGGTNRNIKRTQAGQKMLNNLVGTERSERKKNKSQNPKILPASNYCPALEAEVNPVISLLLIQNRFISQNQ